MEACGVYLHRMDLRYNAKTTAGRVSFFVYVFILHFYFLIQYALAGYYYSAPGKGRLLYLSRPASL